MRIQISESWWLCSISKTCILRQKLNNNNLLLQHIMSLFSRISQTSCKNHDGIILSRQKINGSQTENSSTGILLPGRNNKRSIQSSKKKPHGIINKHWFLKLNSSYNIYIFCTFNSSLILLNYNANHLWYIEIIGHFNQKEKRILFLHLLSMSENLRQDKRPSFFTLCFNARKTNICSLCVHLFSFRFSHFNYIYIYR